MSFCLDFFILFCWSQQIFVIVCGMSAGRIIGDPGARKAVPAHLIANHDIRLLSLVYHERYRRLTATNYQHFELQ